MFSPEVEAHPPSGIFYLIALMQKKHSRHIVISAGDDSAKSGTMIKALNDTFSPLSDTVLITKEDEFLKYIIPVNEFKARQGSPTAYICKGFSCREPIVNPKILKEEVQNL